MGEGSDRILGERDTRGNDGLNSSAMRDRQRIQVCLRVRVCVYARACLCVCVVWQHIHPFAVVPRDLPTFLV